MPSSPREALAILQMVAWLAPAPIPHSLFEDQRDAAVELAGLSLTKLDGETLRVHRLVQEVTRTHMESEPNSLGLASALLVVTMAFPIDPGDARSWITSEPLRAHALVVTKHAARTALESASARLLSMLGVYLRARALYADAEPVLQRALAIDEVSFGPHHPKVAGDLNNLAVLLRDMNRPADAEPLMRRALCIRLALTSGSGHRHPDLIDAAASYAVMLLGAGIGPVELLRKLAMLGKPYGMDLPAMLQEILRT